MDRAELALLPACAHSARPSVRQGAYGSVPCGRLRLVTTKGPNISNRTRWVMAFLGGVIFLYGARLARGCTSGQALSGGCGQQEVSGRMRGEPSWNRYPFHFKEPL